MIEFGWRLATSLGLRNGCFAGSAAYASSARFRRTVLGHVVELVEGPVVAAQLSHVGDLDLTFYEGKHGVASAGLDADERLLAHRHRADRVACEALAHVARAVVDRDGPVRLRS